MSDILPPQLVGVHQSSLYVKVRKIVTVIAAVWLIMAVTGLGFFSGGTTSLAFSLILMYGTGAAIIVVIAAVYRGIKMSAIRRSETAPEDTAALAFIDTTRSAADELLAALRPAPPTGRAYAPAARTVGPAVSMIEAVAAARAASNAAAVALVSAPAAAKRAVETAADGAKPVKQDSVKAAGTKAPLKTAAAKAGPATANAAKSPAAKTPAAKSPAAKTPAAKTTAGKKPAAKNAVAKATASKSSAVKTTAAKSSAVKTTAAKKPAGKKQPPRSGAQQPKNKPAQAVPAAAAPAACPPPAKGQAKSQRPALVLASSNPVPQAVQKMHGALTRQKAS